MKMHRKDGNRAGGKRPAIPAVRGLVDCHSSRRSDSQRLRTAAAHVEREAGDRAKVEAKRRFVFVACDRSSHHSQFVDSGR